jgi:hypothetical protein
VNCDVPPEHFSAFVSSARAAVFEEATLGFVEAYELSVGKPGYPDVYNTLMKQM